MRASEFVESYFDAWNDCDPQGIAEHLSANGIYRDVPENQKRTPEELIISLKEFFSNFQHHYELIGEIQKSKNTIAFQYSMYPFKNDPDHDKSISYRGAEFITLSGDSAIAITDYYDVPAKLLVNKYAKSGLTSEQMVKHKHRLDQVMRTQKVFLKPDLTMPKLADTVGCSVNHLSQVINSGFGTSFFDYLNHYRIEHARELLCEFDNQGNAILNIAFEVGFNSNSAFYAAFKKFVGQTPAQYRRQHLKDS
jgi:AraC-like DNA-binding protein